MTPEEARKKLREVMIAESVEGANDVVGVSGFYIDMVIIKFSQTLSDLFMEGFHEGMNEMDKIHSKVYDTPKTEEKF